MAFMKLVEQNRADVREFGIILDKARENALGYHLDARRVADFRFETNAIADRLPYLFTSLLRHELCRSTRRNTTRFKHHDLFVQQPRRVEQCERNLRGLTSARRRLEYQPRPCLQRGTDIRQ
jgi:hypothetical protein